jgi:hypothetical protein
VGGGLAGSPLGGRGGGSHLDLDTLGLADLIAFKKLFPRRGFIILLFGRSSRFLPVRFL